MGISKQQVFLVSGRYRADNSSEPRGSVVNLVVCSANEEGVRALIAEKAAEFMILSVTSLISLEETARKIKATLAGNDNEWVVVVDPLLHQAEC